MKTYLLLENGEAFEGLSIGVFGETIGEVAFTTGMGGYMETLTDSAYYGQLIAQTFPLIGNYGTITADADSSAVCCRGYIVRELCAFGSNFRKESELCEFLTGNKVIGICGIDTRRLTKIIRENGVMNGMITPSLSDKDGKIAEMKKYRIKDAPKNTTVKAPSVYGSGRKVVLIDYGAKKNIINELTARNCEVTVMPCTATAEEILAAGAQGIVLSDGGGDPQNCAFEIEQLKILNKRKLPTFGIGLGHQLMALAGGGKTEKLKYGHRGANQPVKDAKTGNVYITNQNHGYAVKSKSLAGVAVETMSNLNDKTCEGVEYLDKPCFTVQFHPGSHGGPNSTQFLFDNFIKLTEVGNA